MAEKEYKVSRLLWENLEAVLLAQGKRFVKDIAKTLKVNEKELLKQVFPTKDSFKVAIYDGSSESNQCSAYITGGPVTHLCRKPIVTGSAFCAAHATIRYAVEPTETTVQLRKVQDGPARPALWIHPDGCAMDVHGIVRGVYNADTNKLTLLEIVPTE
jgi:hypothetical protein